MLQSIKIKFEKPNKEKYIKNPLIKIKKKLKINIKLDANSV